MASKPPADPVKLEGAGDFSASAPPDFKLAHDPKRGVYELRSEERGVAVEHMRIASTTPPDEAARSIVKQRGLELVSEQAEAERATAVAKQADGRSWTVIVRRDGPETLSVTSFGRLAGATAPEQPGDERVAEWIASSAAGGTPVALPEKKVEATIEPIELKDYTTTDGLATGKVPAEAGWATGGVNGALEATHPQRGELHLGIPAFVCLPGGQSAAIAQLSPPGWVIAPLLSPDMAVMQVWPELCNRLEPGVGVGGVEIQSAHPQNWGSPFNAGFFEIRFHKANGPWRGAILAGTAPVPADDKWLLYYSELAVPDSDDSSVSQALLKAWEAYDPSKAQGPRAAAVKKAYADVTEMIRSATTLRQQTFETTAASWSEQFRA